MSDPLHVLVAGGGVVGLETLLALRDLAGERVRSTLLTPEPEFNYRPMAVAEPFARGQAKRHSLEEIARDLGAAFVPGRLTGVDAPAQEAITDDGRRPFDALVIGVGADDEPALPRVLTWTPESDAEVYGGLLRDLDEGYTKRVAFVVPVGVAWPLPAYELALMTREFLTERGTRGVEVVVATPEDRPLGLFGPDASAAVAELLASREVELVTGVAARAWQNGVLVTADGSVEADAVVALPALRGPGVPGLPHDGRGFVPTDEFGWVMGATDVYAVGDMTQFPVKQGGIAAQQADAAASAIAADAGAPVHPAAFKPVLRGLLMTGTVPRYLRSEPGRGQSEIDTVPLWWPPAKIVGRHLAPFLASRFGAPDDPPSVSGMVEIDIELDRHGRLRSPV
jgi:sulfide:quinone oxidoreductase